MLDKYSKYHDKCMLVGDFIAVESQFLCELNVKSIVKGNTYFKNAWNPSSNDLFVTNSPLSFQNATAISNGPSGFHKMLITGMKVTFKKYSSTEGHDRHFDQFKFKNDQCGCY